MNDLLARMDPALLIPIVALVIPVVAIAGGLWRSVRTAEAEAQLKRELVAAGMPTDDIVRIVSATAGGRVPAAPPRA